MKCSKPFVVLENIRFILLSALLDRDPGFGKSVRLAVIVFV